MTPPRRAKLVLLVLAIALVGLGVWRGEPVWWWVTTERVYEQRAWASSSPVSLREFARGWYRVRRWGSDRSSEGPAVYWYGATGFRAATVLYKNAGALQYTRWRPDGTVIWQIDGLNSAFRNSSPWLWGVTDQTSPSIPAWMKDDAKWQAALDAQE